MATGCLTGAIKMTLANASISPLFGELLIRAEALTPEQLTRCLETSFDKGLVPAEVLITEGLLDTRLLGETLKIQRLIRHADLDLLLGVKALRQAIENSLDVVSAVRGLGWISDKLPYVSEVGRILLEAEIVEPATAVNALLRCPQESKPLGSILVKESIIEQTTLWSALRGVTLADGGRMRREEIIEYLKSAARRGFLIELLLPDAEEPKRRGEWVRLGELLATSGIIEEEVVLEALEGAMDIGLPLGRFLRQAGLLTEEQVQKALDIQTLVSTNTITPLQATGVAKQVIGGGAAISEAIQRLRDSAHYVRKITESQKVIALDDSGG